MLLVFFFKRRAKQLQGPYSRRSCEFAKFWRKSVAIFSQLRYFASSYSQTLRSCAKNASCRNLLALQRWLSTVATSLLPPGPVTSSLTLSWLGCKRSEADHTTLMDLGYLATASGVTCFTRSRTQFDVCRKGVQKNKNKQQQGQTKNINRSKN